MSCDRFYPFCPARLRKFSCEIPSRRTVDGVKAVKSLCIIQREALVMPRSQHSIFHPRLRCQARNLFRVKIFSRKTLLQFPVFRPGNLFLLHDPLALAEQRIEPPVDKHPKCHIFKIFNPFLNHPLPYLPIFRLFPVTHPRHPKKEQVLFPDPALSVKSKY